METYTCLNLINGKVYVGWTKHTAIRRFRAHVNKARTDSNSYFHSAIRKYGAAAFAVITVWRGNSAEEAKQMECSLIRLLRSNDKQCGYNLTEGGEGTVGCVPSKEARQRMSAAQQGRIDSEETRRLKSEVAKKRPPMSEEVRRRISETKKRQQLHTVHTAETRCKIKESLAGRCTRTTTNKGMVYSAVAKANFSEAQKARWADPKKRAALMEARAR